jgi:hypothetical protein
MEPYGLRDPIGFATLLPREDIGYAMISAQATQQSDDAPHP